MLWLEVSVRADLEAAEAISELFSRYGHGGAVIEEPPPGEDIHVIVKAYLDAEDTATRQRLEEALWHLSQIYPFEPPAFRTLSEEDWSTAWRKDYHVQHIGRHIVIVPSWETYSAATGEVVLSIDPGMAFGTGLHPSTRLCLQALEEEELRGQPLLDLGTGSGILAIYAAKAGAEPIVALDTDPVAVKVALENAKRNAVADRVQVAWGTLEVGGYKLLEPGPFALFPGPFKIIVVNILAEVIAELSPAIAAHLQEGGLIVASGIIAERAEVVQAAWADAGLRTIRRLQDGDWVALIGKPVSSRAQILDPKLG